MGLCQIYLAEMAIQEDMKAISAEKLVRRANDRADYHYRQIRMCMRLYDQLLASGS